MPEADQIELAAYNLTGQVAATLVQGQRPADSYRPNWDGADGQGRSLASGMYVYGLRAGDQREARKLLLQ